MLDSERVVLAPEEKAGRETRVSASEMPVIYPGPSISCGCQKCDGMSQFLS